MTQSAHLKKGVSQQEQCIFVHASQHDIAPPGCIFHHSILSKRLRVFIDVPLHLRAVWAPKIIHKLHRLHSLSVLWLDPSEENVVVDETAGQVYLIDFGRARIRSDLHFQPPASWQKCCNMEVQEVLFFCGLGQKPHEIGVQDNTVYFEE
jgi:serine/threonine protein kinase